MNNKHYISHGRSIWLISDDRRKYKLSPELYKPGMQALILSEIYRKKDDIACNLSHSPASIFKEIRELLKKTLSHG